jgi:hypothetical protein
MKIKILTLISAVFVMLFCALPGKAGVEVSFGVNFGELNDYGEWIHVRGVGRVWHPDADEGWQPFRYGHWVYSGDGWLWNSDEPFGWIVYHYGNWYYDDEQGWVWIPGYDWSPARVEWYVTDHEIGWAPLLPPGRSHQFASMHWMFCPTPLFASIDIGDHIEIRPHPAHGEIRAHVYPGAPRFEFVKHFSHSPVVRMAPKKIRVEDGPHALIRLEFGNRPQADIGIHVGPKFRRSENRGEFQPKPHPGFHPEPAHPSEPPRRIQPEGRSEDRGEFQPKPHPDFPPEPAYPSEPPRRIQPEERRVTVQPMQHERPEVREKAESNNKRIDDSDNDRTINNDDNGQKKLERRGRDF